MISLWFGLLIGCGEKSTDTSTDVPVEGTDADGDGFASTETGGEDCDDFNPDVYPGAADSVGDDKDQNCDGLDGVDDDGDGFASQESGGADCDDAEPARNPSAEDVCGDSLDNDCDGTVDEGTPWYEDADGDGYGSASTGVDACDAPAGHVSNGQDCDDSNSDPTKVGDLCGPYGISMMHIPADTYLMGSPDDEVGRENNEQQHQVTLSKNFYIMTTEVTQRQFSAVMGYNPAAFGPNGTNNDCGLDCPIESMTWHEAARMANILSGEAGKQECYTCSQEEESWFCSSAMSPYSCNGYRLPTEAEWELAARSGTEESFWTPGGGSNLIAGEEYECSNSLTLQDGTALADIGWFCVNNGQPNQSNYGVKQVAQLMPNGFGLYDMHGNVWEVMHDLYGDYEDSYVPTDPEGPSDGDTVVARGGFWNINPAFVRIAMRGDVYPGDRYDAGGFRLAILED